MNRETVFDAVSQIRQDYIEEADGREMPKAARPVKWLIAACVCLIFAGALWLFPREKALPFALTAYAVDEKGKPAAGEMAYGEDLPVSVFDMGSGARAFVFSYPAAHMNEKPHITTVYAPSYSGGENLKSISIAYWGEFVYAKTGNVYIYYIFEGESSKFDFTYRTIPDGEGKCYDVSVSVFGEKGSYLARLNGISEAKGKTADSAQDWDTLLEPYQTVLDKLNAENGWSLAVAENEKEDFYQSYKALSTEEFEKVIREAYRQDALERLRKKYPEYFAVDREKGADIYVWQIAENGYLCGILEKTEGERAEKDIWDLQFKGISVAEAKWILDEIGVEKGKRAVLPAAQPYSDYIYPLDEAYREKIARLFD